MRYLIALLAVMVMVGCDSEGTVSPTPITIVNQNTNTNNAGGGDPTAQPPSDTTNNTVTLSPDSLTLEVDRRAAVSVTVTTPGGVSIGGPITVSIEDDSVVMFSEVIGERLFLRGVNVGETNVIVQAGGSSAFLNVRVVAQS